MTDFLSPSRQVRGVPNLHLNIIPKSSTNGTLVVYLLDVDNLTNQGAFVCV